MEKSAPTSDKIKIPFIKIKKEEELEEGVIEEEPIKPPVKKRPIVPIILDEPEELIEDDENEEIQEDVIEPESKKNETPQQDCPDGYIQEKVNLTLDEIENGLTVNHSTFGDGKIIKFDKERSRVFIKFENETKELDPEYANLKRYNCLKVQQDPDAVPYIDFSMDDPEYTEIISQISKEEPIQEIVEEPIREEIEQNTEPVDEKKTKLFRKIWKGKRIV
jgi:hypothetical protein